MYCLKMEIRRISTALIFKLVNCGKYMRGVEHAKNNPLGASVHPFEIIKGFRNLILSDLSP
jgi:hypothetical protein